MNRALATAAAGLLAALPARGHCRPGQALLKASWRDYVRHFVQDDGRTIDRGAANITTSEGQAYGLVRAVWADDRDTFERLLVWTRDNLQGGDPGRLPAWKWGSRADGSWGVLDENPASDADQWMAYALLGAAKRWSHPSYRDQALQLLGRVWEDEVAQVGPLTVLLPGPWARDQDPVPLNPSYFLPFAWRAFAAEDSAHPWAELIDPGYALLGATMSDGQLPPDWMFIDATSGEVVRPPTDVLRWVDADIFGYEAHRLPWTLAADVAWYDDLRARRLLVGFAGLGSDWQRRGIVPARMLRDGTPMDKHEHLALYGSLLPAWGFGRPEDADALYQTEIEPQRSRSGWGMDHDYYGQNWAWLGIALWAGYALPPEAM